MITVYRVNKQKTEKKKNETTAKNKEMESKMHKSKLLRLKLMRKDCVLNNLSIVDWKMSCRSVKHRFDQNA